MLKTRPHSTNNIESVWQAWLFQRGLLENVAEEARPDIDLLDKHPQWAFYKFTHQNQVQLSNPKWKGDNMQVAFHGTWFYALWSILRFGQLLESCDESLGHEFWMAGVYCSPNLATATGYARPQVLFSDGVYHRVILELRVMDSDRLKSRQRGGQQWIYRGHHIHIYGFWVMSNAPPAAGDERLNHWNPTHEAIPVGCKEALHIV